MLLYTEGGTNFVYPLNNLYIENIFNASSIFNVLIMARIVHLLSPRARRCLSSISTLASSITVY